MNTNGGKLYACFVDFHKAFDSIWHQGLFHKLTNYGICGNFNNLIESLYSQLKCAIRIGNKMTTYFRYQRGVRQGCILSPLLFNIYLNELPTLLMSPKSNPLIFPDGTQLKEPFSHHGRGLVTNVYVVKRSFQFDMKQDTCHVKGRKFTCKVWRTSWKREHNLIYSQCCEEDGIGLNHRRRRKY